MYLVSTRGKTFHILFFQDKLYNADVSKGMIRRRISNIVQAVPVYGWHTCMQTMRGTVSITG